MLGAAIATTMGYMAVFIYRAIDTKKYIDIDIFSFENIRLYVCLLIICITAYIGKYSYIVFGIEGIFLLCICKRELISFMKAIKQILLSKLKR